MDADQKIEQIVIVADNSGTLAMNYKTPLVNGISQPLKQLLGLEGVHLIVNSGDPAESLLGTVYRPLLSDLHRKDHFHLVSDGGTVRGGFESGKYQEHERMTPWSLEKRFAYMHALTEAFFEQLKDEIATPFLNGISGKDLDGERKAAFHRLETIRKKALAEKRSGTTIDKFYPLSNSLSDRIGEVFIYDAGAKVTIDLYVKGNKERALERSRGIAKRVDTALNRNNHDFYLFPGPDYVDIVATVKTEGVQKTLIENVLPKLNPSKKTVIIVIGDAFNDLLTLKIAADKEAFSFPNAVMVPVFLSYDAIFAGELGRNISVAKKQYLEGAEQILRWALSLHGKSFAQAPILPVLRWRERGARLSEWDKQIKTYYSNGTAAVLGGTGFVGNHFLNSLIKKTGKEIKEIKVLSRNPESESALWLWKRLSGNEKVSLHRGNHLNIEDIQQVISGAKVIIDSSALAWQHPGGGRKLTEGELLVEELEQNGISAGLIGLAMNTSQRLVWISTNATENMLLRLNEADKAILLDEIDGRARRLLEYTKENLSNKNRYDKGFLEKDLTDHPPARFPLPEKPDQLFNYAEKFSYNYSKFVGQRLLELIHEESGKDIRVLMVSDVYGSGQSIDASLLKEKGGLRRLQVFLAAYSAVQRKDVSWIPNHGFKISESGNILQNIRKDYVSPTYVSDVVRMMLRASIMGKPGKVVFKVSAPALSNRELAEKTLEWVKKASERPKTNVSIIEEEGSERFRKPEGQDEDLKYLGIKLTSLDKGLQRWFESETSQKSLGARLRGVKETSDSFVRPIQTAHDLSASDREAVEVFVAALYGSRLTEFKAGKKFAIAWMIGLLIFIPSVSGDGSVQVFLADQRNRPFLTLTHDQIGQKNVVLARQVRENQTLIQGALTTFDLEDQSFVRGLMGPEGLNQTGEAVKISYSLDIFPKDMEPSLRRLEMELFVKRYLAIQRTVSGRNVSFGFHGGNESLKSELDRVLAKNPEYQKIEYFFKAPENAAMFDLPGADVSGYTRSQIAISIAPIDIKKGLGDPYLSSLLAIKIGRSYLVDGKIDLSRASVKNAEDDILSGMTFLLTQKGVRAYRADIHSLLTHAPGSQSLRELLALTVIRPLPVNIGARLAIAEIMRLMIRQSA